MEFKQLLQKSGIIGAGGAGFPAYAKLAPGADTFLINGAECEPLLYTDFTILRESMQTVLEGARTVMRECGIGVSVLCIKEHNAKKLGFTDGQTVAEGVRVATLPDVYPMGDEINLIYQTLGRLVRPGALPITERVIVNNVETVYNIARAAASELPVTEKTLTVGGMVGSVSPVVTVPVGTSVSWLLSRLGIEVPDDCVVIDGGPSMGRIIDPAAATVKKTTKGILILPESCQAVRAMRRTLHANRLVASSACCQCSACTDMCPRALLGYPLKPHLMVRAMAGGAVPDPFTLGTATLCCGCGVCETAACCQGISPKAVINEFKAYMSKERIRFSAEPDASFVPDAQRSYRQIPVSRWMQQLGVSRFDRPGVRRELADLPPVVKILLGGHIGAPSAPTVSVGDRVARGQTVAQAAEGLSVAQHASVDGKIISIDRTSLTIERDR